jgi:hypothetical protein
LAIVPSITLFRAIFDAITAISYDDASLLRAVSGAHSTRLLTIGAALSDCVAIIAGLWSVDREVPTISDYGARLLCTIGSTHGALLLAIGASLGECITVITRLSPIDRAVTAEPTKTADVPLEEARDAEPQPSVDHRSSEP